jgi:hypothetical protein
VSLAEEVWSGGCQVITEGLDERSAREQAKVIEREQLRRVVHDYDNILAAAGGAIELALRKLARGDVAEAVRLLWRGVAATRRGAELSSRLIAFSRGCDQPA